MNIGTGSNYKSKKMDNLFIKKLKTANQYYVYSVFPNEIIKVKRIIWDIIDQFHKPVDQIYKNMKGKYPKKDILNAHNSIKNAKNAGIFSCHRPGIRSNRKEKKEVIYLFEKAGLKQIIIDLTNRCNMRCKYCIFSGKYKYVRRHKNNEISREVARRAIDYFIKYCSKTETPFVTFYGGEPLLNFSLFKYIVEYIKSNSNRFHFSLTTNGTLLNMEAIYSYLIDNGISINISLDGPKIIHDINRVMINGNGSFDQVMKNLKRIKELAPGYFFSKIYYSPVLTPPYEFDAIKSFFFESDFFKGYNNPLNIAAVSTYATTLFKDTDIPFFNQQYIRGRDQMLANYKNMLIKGNYDDLSLEKHWFKDIIKVIHFREKVPLKKYHTVTGQCTPGLRRLFVNSDGKYYICEKVGEFFCIGDIYKGLDFDRISNFFERCDAFFADCKNCWALRLCERCFADVNCKNRFDKDRKEKFCQSKLIYLETVISVYCEILEENPNAFDGIKAEDFFKE